MCLNTVDKITKTEVKEGYKVFRKLKDGKLCGAIFCKDAPYPKRKWIKDTKKLTLVTADYPYDPYSTGFHTFTTIEGALGYFTYIDEVIHRVLIKDVVASGTQNSYPVVVHKQMMIMEEIASYDAFWL